MNDYDIGFGQWVKWSDSTFNPPRPKWWGIINFYKVYDRKQYSNMYTVYTVRVLWSLTFLQIKVRDYDYRSSSRL